MSGSGMANQTQPRSTKLNVTRPPRKPEILLPDGWDSTAGERERLHSTQRLCMKRPLPCQAPQAKKLQVIPCHKPIKIMVLSWPIRITLQAGAARYLVRSERARGLKKY